MPGSVYLQNDTLTLQTIEEADLPFLRDLINDPAVRRFLPTRPPRNLEQEHEFYDTVVCSDDSVTLLICVDDEPAGTVGLGPTNGPDGSADLGLLLAPDFWNEGYGTAAARLITDYAFREQRLHRVTAEVIAGNDASRRIWEKLGYRQEATHKEAAFRDGEYTDVYLYAIRRSEWLDD